jgi:hypothetical protein
MSLPDTVLGERDLSTLVNPEAVQAVALARASQAA